MRGASPLARSRRRATIQLVRATRGWIATALLVGCAAGTQGAERHARYDDCAARADAEVRDREAGRLLEEMRAEDRARTREAIRRASEQVERAARTRARNARFAELMARVHTTPAWRRAHLAEQICEGLSEIRSLQRIWTVVERPALRSRLGAGERRQVAIDLVQMQKRVAQLVAEWERDGGPAIPERPERLFCEAPSETALEAAALVAAGVDPDAGY